MSKFLDYNGLSHLIAKMKKWVSDGYATSSHTHTLTTGATDVTASATELNYSKGVTSAIQTQLNGKSASGHTHTLATGATDVTATAAELNYVKGVTSAIQTQINGKSASSHTHTLAKGATDVTASATELNYVKGVTSAIQTQLNGKASSSHQHSLSDLNDISATADEVNILSGVTVTADEINTLSGIQTSIQDQLDGKSASTHKHTLANGATDVTASATELNYVKGVTSSIQTQLGTKAPLASPALTGTPTAPTAAAGTNSTQIATTAFVKANAKSGTVSINIDGTTYTSIDGALTALNTLAAANKSALSGLTGIDFQVVSTLPSTGVKGTIYLVKATNSTSYVEWIWIEVTESDSSTAVGKWEQLGTIGDIDITNYWSKTELEAITNDEIDTLMTTVTA